MIYCGSGGTYENGVKNRYWIDICKYFNKYEKDLNRIYSHFQYVYKGNYN